MVASRIIRRPIRSEIRAPAQIIVENLQRMETAKSRPSAWGVLDPTRAAMLASSSWEADFTSSYFRNGLMSSSSPAVLPGWSFGRSGAGTAVNTANQPELFSANEPRMTDRGLLIETLATNRIPYSENDPGTNGFLADVPTIDNDHLEDGVRCISLTFPASSAPGTGVTGAAATTPATLGPATYTASYYLKLSRPLVSGETISVSVTGDTGVGQIDHTSANDPTSFQRFAFTGAKTGTNNVGFYVYAANLTAPLTVLIGNRQLETGSRATSYIPTSGSAATRGQDFAGADLLTPPWPLTVYAEYVHPGRDDRALSLWNSATGTSGNRVLFQTQPAALNVVATSGGIEQVTGLQQTGLSAGQIVRAVITLDAAMIKLCVNGGAVMSDAVANEPGGLNKVLIGRHEDGAYLNEFFRKLIVIPYLLSEAEMQAITS